MSLTSYFDDVLAGVGVVLNNKDEEPLNIIKEQALVVRDLMKCFTDLDNSSELINKFLKGLKEHCKNDRCFKKCLLPTKFQKALNDTGRDNSIAIYQESLVRTLLKVPPLQKEVTNMLLDRITEISTEEVQDTSWLRLLISPLRCLPNIRYGKELATKLLDILEVSTFTSQLEILEAIPDILPDSECDAAARQLTKLLDENDDLCGGIVDCLNALNLDSEVRAVVQDRILAKILAGTTPKIFPILLQFLLNESKSQNLVPILYKIRNALDIIMASGGCNKEKESFKILIFHNLQTFAISQKQVGEAWLTAISHIKNFSDHKAIDYIILFMLHHICEARKRVVELMFKKRVSSGLFKISLLEKTFEKYLAQQLMRNYIGSITEIGCFLFKCGKDGLVVEFATALFQLLFNHTYVLAVDRAEILCSLIVLTGSSDGKTINYILKLILSLISIDVTKVETHMGLLMQLLEKLDILDLKNVKMVFDILCGLSRSEKTSQSLLGFTDEIHIIIRKQLSSPSKNIKFRGILSAIVMVKHLAMTENSQSDVTTMEDSMNITDVPEGPPRDAAYLLELINSCVETCPECLGLYYDQLASIFVNSGPVDKHFLCWLYESATNNFQSTFISETLPESVHNLQINMQYLLNDPKEMAVPMAVDIVGLMVRDKRNMVLVLPPYFRLLRLLHLRQHNNSLATIDALLGCGIVLPEIEDITELDNQQLSFVADCLFHCANWFREIISAFVTQKSKTLKAKVIHRLQELLDLEQKLREIMKCIPTHNLPLGFFDSSNNISNHTLMKIEAKVCKNPRKKFKTVSVINEETTLNTQKSAKPTCSTKRSMTNEQNIQFRDLDTDVLELLRYPLRLDQDCETQFTQSASINIDQLKFLLKDFRTKLSLLTQNKDLGLSHLNDVTPQHLIQDCVLILPHVNRCFGVIVKYIRRLLANTNESQDYLAMYTEEAMDIKLCFGLVLQIFFLIFKWPGFENLTNIDLLRDLLKSMRPESSQTLNSANLLICEFITRLSSYTDECLHLSHAVSLVNAIETLCNCIVPSEEIQKCFTTTCLKLLSKRWRNFNGDLDRGKDCNLSIDVLIKGFLKRADVKTIYGLVGTLEKEAVLLKSKDDSLHMLVAIDKQNFHVLYLGLWNALLNRVKIEIQSLTNNQHLVLWHKIALTMQGFMAIVKIHENRVNLSCFLKKSIGILKIFISHGVPILEIMLKRKPDEVVQIFKDIQITTRFLHSLCCYSRLNQDASLVAHVPMFRHVLETLLFRVKAALAANNCSSAFWMGNLRNKDLHGDEIVSQSQSTVCSSNEESAEGNEKLPSEDEDVALSGEDSDSAIVSESEVFD
ncbi:Fanconi anemia group D2 protein [Cylas formicarius]|uniref:Fanconi anemia group D2 protein n=1 Tax=Cylas formicarius TaxID=197179 RepID=UPI0029587E33|nr:Fanconi anemia group D2 protein [Cylas formicarius]